MKNSLIAQNNQYIKTQKIVTLRNYFFRPDTQSIKASITQRKTSQQSGPIQLCNIDYLDKLIQSRHEERGRQHSKSLTKVNSSREKVQPRQRIQFRLTDCRQDLKNPNITSIKIMNQYKLNQNMFKDLTNQEDEQQNKQFVNLMQPPLMARNRTSHHRAMSSENIFNKGFTYIGNVHSIYDIKQMSRINNKQMIDFSYKEALVENTNNKQAILEDTRKVRITKIKLGKIVDEIKSQQTQVEKLVQSIREDYQIDD